jgi:hypothetical protein
MKDSHADMVYVAGDWLNELTEQAAVETDPEKLAEIEENFQLASAALELATAKAEEEARKQRLSESLLRAADRRERLDRLKADASKRRIILRAKTRREWAREGAAQRAKWEAENG